MTQVKTNAAPYTGTRFFTENTILARPRDSLYALLAVIWHRGISSFPPESTVALLVRLDTTRRLCSVHHILVKLAAFPVAKEEKKFQLSYKLQ